MEYQVVTNRDILPSTTAVVKQIEWDIGRRMTRRERSAVTYDTPRLVDVSNGEHFWDVELRASTDVLAEIKRALR